MYDVAYTGQVVSWCISDQETAEVITVLFNSLKKRSPDTQVTTIMTDDGNFFVHNVGLYHKQYQSINSTDNTGWNAATQVFTKEINHLLCHWHVHRYYWRYIIIIKVMIVICS